MARIGVLSDTHGLLRPEVIRSLAGCDVILHGGDINRQEIIDELEKIAPVYVVRGNNDKDWAEYLPAYLDLSLLGLHIFMTHKKKDLPGDLTGYDLVVFGHSHRYEENDVGGTHLLNPGSCGPRRLNQAITMAIVEVEESQDGAGQNRTAALKIKIRRIDIAHAKASAVNLEKVQKHDVEKVMREIKKGRSVSQIASGIGMDPELTEQICRMYLTHPGVDAEGIMTKLGL